MPVEAAAIGAVASASNTLITLIRHGLHYAEIPEEVKQFRHAIDNLQVSINTSKHLRRVKSHYLDNFTKTEVDGTIKRSESVLDSISRTIEECRADLQTKGTVSAKNRLSWLLDGHQAFMSRVQTLNSCIQILSMQIGRMDAIKPPTSPFDQAPPSYRDSLRPDQELRAPSARKSRSRRLNGQSSISDMSIGNLSTYSLSVEKEVVPRPPAELQRRLSRDNASINSFDDSLSANISSVQDLDRYCAGDYCADEGCKNHDRQVSENAITHTRSLGADFMYSVCDSPSTDSLSTSVASSPNLLRPPSQRRRHKSGLI